MKKEVKVRVTETHGEGPICPLTEIYYGPERVETLFSGVVVGDPEGLIPSDCTLSWEVPDVHECDDLPAWTDIIYNGQYWNVWERKEQGRIKQLLAVLYCPYCGKKLGS